MTSIRHEQRARGTTNGWRVSAAVCAALLFACKPATTTTILTTKVDAASRSASQRFVAPSGLDTVAPVRFALGNPLWIAADESGAVIQDGQRGVLTRVDSLGMTEWRQDLSALGTIRDIRLHGRAVWVLSATRQKAYRIHGTHGVADSVDVRAAGHVEQILPLSGGRLVTVALDSATPLVVVAPDGRIVHRYAMPWKDYAGLHALSRYGQLFESSTGMWGYAFGTGDRWLMVDQGGRLLRSEGYVESVPFPDVMISRTGRNTGAQLVRHEVASMGAQASGDTVAVLFGGKRRTRGRYIDLYSTTTGEYLGSWTLPVRASGFALGKNHVYTISGQSNTEIIVYRRSGLRVASR